MGSATLAFRARIHVRVSGDSRTGENALLMLRFGGPRLATAGKSVDEVFPASGSKPSAALNDRVYLCTLPSFVIEDQRRTSVSITSIG